MNVENFENSIKATKFEPMNEVWKPFINLTKSKKRKKREC